MKNLFSFLNPKSVAVIGASRDPQKIGFIVLKNIMDFGFKGAIYPVNPNAESLVGLRCYKDYDSLPETPELAIISIPSQFVLDVMKQIAAKGTKNVVIFSAGFKEAGHQGAVLEKDLTKIAEDNNINLLGPNCLGFANTEGHINATFGNIKKYPGNLRFVSQSGAIATSIFDWAEQNQIGFTEFVTLGNKPVLSETDFLEYWLKTEKPRSHIDEKLSNTSPVGVYVESLDDGIEFLNIASQMSLKNPVFMIKPGRSHAAQKAMQSHTGALAGEEDVLEAALRDSGITRCFGLEDFFDMAKAFSWENAPEGNSIAIVSNAGGPAVVTTDFIEAAGLRLADINEQTRSRLEKYLPDAANISNPVDVLGDALAQRYGDALDAVLGQQDIDAAVVILTPQVMTEIYLTATLISKISASHRKPILCAFMGGTHIEEGEKVLNQHKIPNFRFPERAVKALGEMWKWKKSVIHRTLEIQALGKSDVPYESNTVNENQVYKILENARSKNPHLRKIVLNSFEVEEIFKSWNILTPPSLAVTNLNDAMIFAQNNRWPVVLKIISWKLLHKTELGGVILNIKSAQELEKAYAELNGKIQLMDEATRKSCMIQIQKQTENGVELILGVKKDPSFGHVMMFGAGGVLAEIIQDKNLKLLPVDRFNSTAFVDYSRIAKVLKGFRGEKPYPISKLQFLMEKMSDLVQAFPDFEEIEINPVILTHEDIWSVDGKAIIS